MRVWAIIGAVLLVAGSADAGTTADQCAAGLAKDPRAIYDACAASVQPSTDIKALLTQKTRGLVMAGTVDRASARDSARAAAPCLELKQKSE
jgi:hypothetical protein